MMSILALMIPESQKMASAHPQEMIRCRRKRGSLFDDPPGFFDDNDDMPVSLEIEAYEFSVSGDYTNVWCYLQLNDEDVVRYEFDPEGDRYWNIAEALSGVNSVRIATSLDEPLSVFLDCWAETIYLHGDPSREGPGEIGAWGTTYDLGTYTFTHGPEDWGGGELYGFGSGPDGESFWARYHICSPSCDETAIQPPILDPITFDERGIGPSMLRWRWGGDEETIEGFLLSVNGTYYNTSRNISPESRSLDISDFEPGCGEVLEFRMQAFGSDWASSTSWRHTTEQHPYLGRGDLSANSDGHLLGV